MNEQDHDLLVGLHVEVKQIRTDIKDLKDGTSNKILDHELRLRRLELWGAIALGLSYALNFYFNYLHK